MRSATRAMLDKVRRHYTWARESGLGRLVEEDRLDPRERVRTALSKAAWRRHSAVVPGTATVVHVLGLQRSGTNMLLRGIELAPEVEVHNENDSDVFDRYLLRDDAVVRRVADSSRHSHVLFKPLCDSHRLAELLALAPQRSAALWVYRNVDDRVRSSVAKFGGANLAALRAIAAGTAAGRWEAGGLTEDDLALVRSMPLDSFSAESGSALLWYLRNNLLFRSGLSGRADVSVVSYDRFVAAPREVMPQVCRAIHLRYRDELVAHVDPHRSGSRPALDLSPAVRELCDDMLGLLDGVALPATARP